MGTVVKCEICGSDADSGSDWAVLQRECPRCGRFDFGLRGPKNWPKGDPGRAKLSGWVRDQNDAGIVPQIDAELTNRVQAMPMPGYVERANRLATLIADRKSSPLARHSYDEVLQTLEVLGRTYSWAASDLGILFEVLKGREWIADASSVGSFTLTVKGLLELEELSKAHVASSVAFVAMSFSKEMNEAWARGFDPGVRKAGFEPLRIDAKEYVGGISDEIMAEIRKARFVVADYTQQRHGVYFEAGFALGLGLTVIPTCREDEIGSLHFDIRHLNTLAWKTPDDLATALTRRIVAVMGEGPVRG